MDLLKTADRFAVPAMHGVYTGGPRFRRDLPCFHGDRPDCPRFSRMAISLISAYQLWAGQDSPIDTATTVLNDSIPLEDLVDPELSAKAVYDMDLSGIDSAELRDFLLRSQHGPREIAKRILR